MDCSSRRCVVLRSLQKSDTKPCFCWLTFLYWVEGSESVEGIKPPIDLSFPNMVSTRRDEFGTREGPTAYDDTLEWIDIVPWLRAHTKMVNMAEGHHMPRRR